MKIKRYIGKDMREVLWRVRQEQGPDAVILSTRRVEEGIELIAAIDYDEALMRQATSTAPPSSRPGGQAARQPTAAATGPDPDAPAAQAGAASPPVEQLARELVERIPAADDEARHAAAAATSAVTVAADTELTAVQAELRSLRGLLETQLSGILWKRGAKRAPLRAQILRNLALIGVAPDVARGIADGLEPVENVRQLWRDPLARLVQAVPVLADGLLEEGGSAALVGPTGVGKTTTIAKLAAAWAMRHGAGGIALVCADAYRIGAREHLEAFAKVIGVPVHCAADTRELDRVLERVRSKQLVLIDTEGVSQRDLGLSSRLASHLADAGRARLYLALSAASQEAGLDETVRQFRQLPLTGAVITKIDEAAQLGCVLGTLIRHELPAAWLSDGQRIPDDLYPAGCKKLWLAERAVHCLERSGAQVSERTMAENYGQAAAANA